ncbi:aldo/keto reductase [Methanogenium organophilum]|uniref:Aldo/keto reductase n=1 Tax=Methanogenium organophilum TaxID=2199 RepID=A0A9X9S5L3_METOG|nr:aldo/keto reductase [Methanogenium organophilum]WAI02359.1 aldo/keto reductase [Methanogenium organophilum]
MHSDEETAMQYRTVPKTGDRLSVLGFGAMRLPMKGRAIDEERATALIRAATVGGINYIDTAVPYHMGTSEAFVGRALAGKYREQVKVATKLPPWTTHSRADMDATLAAQCSRLKTHSIDYYLLHSLNRENWDKLLTLGVMNFLDEAEKSGRIKNAGFSFHGDPETFQEIVDARDWVFCQIQYNILDEEHQAGTRGLRYAAKNDLAVMVMEPLRGGMLANTVPPAAQACYDAAPVQRSPATHALRWVMNHPDVTVVLSGMSDEAQLIENLQTAREARPESLTPDEETMMRMARDAWRRAMQIPCTGCGYCMPCPYGVNIPECFNLWNNHSLREQKRGAKTEYAIRLGGGLGDSPGNAGLCRDCGRCKVRCPQQIPIPSALREMQHMYEGPFWGAKKVFISYAAGIATRILAHRAHQGRDK